FRLILSDYVSKEYSFGTSSIAEIIIGLRAEEREIEELITKLRQNNSAAKLFRLVRSQSKFELGYEEISY
ncbi:MAG: hypothetical protein MUP82_06035, partial [Candidatus Marinimicrobia bacterium]|nr:hypothetical protein [Candidatus Neomarinimicrobiota bacterium]